MKVTVCFDDVKVVVPCGNGDILIRELAEMALLRFQKSTASLLHTKCCIDQNVVTLCTGGSQIKSLEEGQKSERRNLEQQHHQHWMELDQSNNDSHIQLDNGNVSWKSNIDSDYELDSLRLARDGGILDWDDRVVDVLDDRELLIVNFRRKLPTSLPNTLIHPNELPYSSCNHRKSPQNESVLFTNDDSLVRNQINLSTSVNNSSLAPSSSSLFKITSSPLSLTVCSPPVTGRILCDTGVTYVQLPYPQRQQQTFQIIASSSSSVDVTYSTPQHSQFYSDHQQISPLSRRGCLEESCDCFCLTESDINAKETMFPKDNEVKINQTGQFQNVKPTGYNQYTSHPITTLIGGLEYELYSTKTPAAFRPPTNTSSVITTPTFSIKQTSVSTTSPLVHRLNRSAPPPPPPPPPPPHLHHHHHHHQYSHGNSLLQMPISLPPLAQPCTVECNRSIVQNPMHQITTITTSGHIINDYDNKVYNNKLDGINCRYCDQIHDYQYHEDVTMHHSASPNVLYSRGSPLPQSMMDRYDYVNMPQVKLDDDHDVVHFHHANTNTTTTNNNNNSNNNTPHPYMPTSILSLSDYLLSNSLLSTLNTTDINIITNVNNDDLLMDTSFLSTVPEEEDFSEITSSSRTTPKQSPCKQIYLIKQENKNSMKLTHHNNDIHDVGLYSSPESSSSPSTVLHKSQPIQIREMESFSSSSGQTFSDGNVEGQLSSSPSKLSKIQSSQSQEMSDNYCSRPNRKQKRYRNSRAPAPPTPSVTSSPLPVSSCINQPTIPLPPPPPPRPTKNIDTPCTSDSDNDGDYKNSPKSRHNHKMSETSSSPELKYDVKNQMNLSKLLTRKPTPPKRSSKTTLTSINTSPKSEESEKDKINSVKYSSVTDSKSVESGTSCEHKSDDSDKGNLMEQTCSTTTITSTITTTCTTPVKNNHYSYDDNKQNEQKAFPVYNNTNQCVLTKHDNEEEITCCLCNPEHHVDAEAEVLHMTELLSKRRESEVRRHLLLAEMEGGIERDHRLRAAANAMALAASAASTNVVNSNDNMNSSDLCNIPNCIHYDCCLHQQQKHHLHSDVKYNTSPHHHLHSIDHRTTDNEIIPPLTCCCSPNCIKEEDILISLQKSSSGLGFSLTTKLLHLPRSSPTIKSNHSNEPVSFAVCVKNILPDGSAIKDGQLRVGDRLIQIDDLDVIGKSQTHIVAILRIKPVGSIVNLLVRRHVHRCQLHLHDCFTCYNMLHSLQLYKDEMNQSTRQQFKCSTLNHNKYTSTNPWIDLQLERNTRKCSSPPLSMNTYSDGLESVYHPNYPLYPDVILLRLHIPLIPVNDENTDNIKNYPINCTANTSPSIGLRQMRLGVSVRESTSSRASKLNELTQNTLKAQTYRKLHNDDRMNQITLLTDSYIADSIYGGVIVKCIIEGGAAHKDGRLQVGDELLEINGIVLVNADSPLSLLRSVLRKLSSTIMNDSENKCNGHNVATTSSVYVTGTTMTTTATTTDTMATTTTTTTTKATSNTNSANRESTTDNVNNQNNNTKSLCDNLNSVEMSSIIQPKMVDLLIARLKRHRRSASGHTIASNSEIGSETSTTSTVLTVSNNNDTSKTSPESGVNNQELMVNHRQRHRSHHQHHSHHRHSSKHQQKCYCSNSPPTLETTSSVSHSPASSSSLTTTISTGNELHMNTVNVADRHHNHNNNKMSTIKPELHSVKVEHEQETIGDEIVPSVTMATSGGDGHGENMTKCSSHNQ